MSFAIGVGVGKGCLLSLSIIVQYFYGWPTRVVWSVVARLFVDDITSCAESAKNLVAWLMNFIVLSVRRKLKVSVGRNDCL